MSCGEHVKEHCVHTVPEEGQTWDFLAIHFACIPGRHCPKYPRIEKQVQQPLISVVLLSEVSVTYSDLWPENTKWKIPTRYNSLVVNCAPF